MSTPQGWQTPKTDWDSKDPVGVSDLNRMEGNPLAIETGDRTLDPAQAPTGNVGNLRQILSWFANRIKAIMGTTNWWDAPPMTLKGATPNTRKITAGNGLTGGGDLSADRTITLGTPSTITATTSNSVTSTSHTHALSGATPNTRKITAGNGLTGGGDLSADRTITLGTPSTITATTSNSVTSTSHTHALSGATPNTRKITAGNGLTGGGDLSADRTITLGTPSTITATTSNSVTSTSHTHALSGISRIAAGSYVGDGEASRTVSVGFTPKCVILVHRDGSSIAVSNSSGYPKIVSGGFVVSGSSPGSGNYQDRLYDWVAFA